MQIDSFDKLQFQYNTGQIPPPFCFIYDLSISVNHEDRYTASLNLEYFDREELKEEELYNEGFTPEDNVKWQGDLPKIWVEEIQKKLQSTNWKKKPVTNDDGSMFIIKISTQNQAEILQPADIRAWEIFVQEIIQAIFELSKKEAPLFISFVSKTSKNDSSQVDFEFSFADRTIRIKSNKHLENSLTWKEGQKLLKHIYGIDYLLEDGSPKLPNKKGYFISPGDNLWHELKEGNLTDNKITKEAKLLASLLNYVN